MKVTQYKTGKASLYAQGGSAPAGAAARAAPPAAVFAAAPSCGGSRAALHPQVAASSALSSPRPAARRSSSWSVRAACDATSPRHPPPRALRPAPERQAALRPQAVGLWRPDQARVPQEGQDDQEDRAAPAVRRVQGHQHEAHQGAGGWGGGVLGAAEGGGDGRQCGPWRPGTRGNKAAAAGSFAHWGAGCQPVCCLFRAATAAVESRVFLGGGMAAGTCTPLPPSLPPSLPPPSPYPARPSRH
jgi:hypothetical protein